MLVVYVAKTQAPPFNRRATKVGRRTGNNSTEIIIVPMGVH